ncbi:MAG: hypothetical protein K2Q18_07390, partial [Bdellovibrionales bacterium]|nr:hypothetical protein [Bdellovibrionales bacterium]
MDGVYESFVKVIPYVYSDEKNMEVLRTDPGQKEKLLKNLTDISEFFKSARHVEYFQRPGFRPSLETINYHLEDTINSVKSNNYVFAQKRLKALTALCISCHSQLSEKASENTFGNAIKKVKRDNFESDFGYGNYLFLVRRFSEAEKFFDLSIEKALKDGNEAELYPSLRRIVSINSKINFSPKGVTAFTEKYLTYPLLPPLAKNTLVNWNSEIKKWQGFEPKKVKSIDAFIKKYLVPLENKRDQALSGEFDITLLVASGVLSKHLNDFPKSKLAPEILYWLSIAERRLSSTYFFSLSDLYLKDCVKLYSKSKYAQRCYDEYADNIEFGYSGSGGTDIPAEEKRELIRLKGYLK